MTTTIKQLNNTLLEAAKIGDLAAAQQALDNGADVNALNKSNDTPLYWVASKGSKEAAALLQDAIDHI